MIPLLLALLLAPCLSGCGQKGDLYLEPANSAPAAQAQTDESEEEDGA